MSVYLLVSSSTVQHVSVMEINKVTFYLDG